MAVDGLSLLAFSTGRRDALLLELGHRAWQQLNDPPAPAPLHPSKARHSDCSGYGIVNGQAHAWQQGFPGTRNNLTRSHWRIAVLAAGSLEKDPKTASKGDQV